MFSPFVKSKTPFSGMGIGPQFAPLANQMTPAKKSKFVAYQRAQPIALHSNEYYFNCAIGGLLSCGLTHTGIVSLDLVKCRMQTDPVNYPGLISGGKRLFSEGAKGMVKGWAPTLIGYSIQGICKFGFYEFFKKKYSDMAGEDAEKYKDILFLSASASAEIIADFGLCPWESIKVRIQTQEGFASTLREAAPKMYAAEGISAFFKGLVPLWLRQVPYTMMKFWAFERTVNIIYDNFVPKPREECNKAEKLGVTFAAGYIAGIFCAIVSHPADTVVSKLNQVKGGSIGGILKEAGFSGIWRGLGARILMIGTLTGLQWFIYDSFKVSVGLPASGGKLVAAKQPEPVEVKK